MIESAAISIQYIKKEDFTGSYQGMRYRLAKSGEEIEAVIWPQPYNYFKTPEIQKQRKRFALSVKGKEEAVAWLNAKYEEERQQWENALYENGQ